MAVGLRHGEGMKGMKATYHSGVLERVGRVVGGIIGRSRRRRGTFDEGYVPLQDVDAV